jgi:hypothetical protein
MCLGMRLDFCESLGSLLPLGWLIISRETELRRVGCSQPPIHDDYHWQLRDREPKVAAVSHHYRHSLTSLTNGLRPVSMTRR